MFDQRTLENILFLDIETVTGVSAYEELSTRMQNCWDKKALGIQRREGSELTSNELYGEKGAIFAEFGKVICISCGYLRMQSDQFVFKTKSFFGHDEATVLKEFAGTIDQFMATKGRNLCAHNGKEFDFPYLGRRYLVNGLKIPSALNMQGKKPWEVPYIDTMELWKMGDYKSFTSLDLLTAILDIPTPKDDIDGSEVGRVYWNENDLERIARYCEKDVLATAQVLLKFSGFSLIPDSHVING